MPGFSSQLSHLQQANKAQPHQGLGYLGTQLPFNAMGAGHILAWMRAWGSLRLSASHPQSTSVPHSSAVKTNAPQTVGVSDR